MQRLGDPDEIATVAAFLCTDDASWVTGQTIMVSGGASCT
jgi:3-oxoacyl-[acyl-carrier protein] reductase